MDNIRDLRQNALYRPARARFKIYIIDEVHMLSSGAFNALTKSSCASFRKTNSAEKIDAIVTTNTANV